ncbi:hypothetical protein [Methanolobus sp. WCC4]
MASWKGSVSLPKELRERVDKYNKENPARKLNLSAILQAGVEEILTEEGY